MDAGTCTIFAAHDGSYGWRYTAATGPVRSMERAGFGSADEAREAFEALWRARAPDKLAPL